MFYTLIILIFVRHTKVQTEESRETASFFITLCTDKNTMQPQDLLCLIRRKDFQFFGEEGFTRLLLPRLVSLSYTHLQNKHNEEKIKGECATKSPVRKIKIQSINQRWKRLLRGKQIQLKEIYIVSPYNQFWNILKGNEIYFWGNLLPIFLYVSVCRAVRPWRLIYIRQENVFLLMSYKEMINH